MLYRFLTPNFPLLPPVSFGWFEPNKAKLLIQDRHIPLFVKYHKLLVKQEHLLLKFLLRLQKLVYKLDEYGERNWQLDSNVIKTKWNNIVRCIVANNFSQQEAESLLQMMNTYMHVEINMRSNKLPTRMSIGDYYELKICDVQLQREIIRKRASFNFNKEYYRLWQLIDIISEVTDDIDDLEEDSFDFNCNRMIISKHFRGTPIIKNDYATYISSIKEEFQSIIETQPDTVKNNLLEIFNSKFSNFNSKLETVDFSKYQSRVINELEKENKVTTADFSMHLPLLGNNNL